MQQHTQIELIKFLQAVDEHLRQPQRLLIIGGAAASIAYRATLTTSDIDTANALSKDFEAAVKKAREATGLDIPIGTAGIYDAPYEWEGRLITPEDLEFNSMSVFVPERHDLALMKIMRAEEHDIQVLLEMHEVEPFKLEILTSRFLNEMTHVIGQLPMIRFNFIALVAELFGDEVGVKVEEQTKQWGEVRK